MPHARLGAPNDNTADGAADGYTLCDTLDDMRRHRRDLESLKDIDPEFYDFLNRSGLPKPPQTSTI
jgi:hypothetical protein